MTTNRGIILLNQILCTKSASYFRPPRGVNARKKFSLWDQWIQFFQIFKKVINSTTGALMEDIQDQIESLEIKLGHLETMMSKFKSRLDYAMDSNRTLAETNRRCIDELQELTKEKHENKHLRNKIMRLDTYIKKLDKAYKLEVKASGREDKDG